MTKKKGGKPSSAAAGASPTSATRSAERGALLPHPRPLPPPGAAVRPLIPHPPHPAGRVALLLLTLLLFFPSVLASKSTPPPADLCVRHPETRLFPRYTVNLYDSFGDGWNAADGEATPALIFVSSDAGTSTDGMVLYDGLRVPYSENDFDAIALLNGTFTLSKGSATVCFGCGCYVGFVGAALNSEEMSWNLTDTNTGLLVVPHGKAK